MERKAIITIVVCVLVLVLFSMTAGCSSYPSEEPRTYLSDDEYILVCEYRGGSKECGYVERREVNRELDFLRDRARY